MFSCDVDKNISHDIVLYEDDKEIINAGKEIKINKLISIYYERLDHQDVCNLSFIFEFNSINDTKSLQVKLTQ